MAEAKKPIYRDKKWKLGGSFGDERRRTHRMLELTDTQWAALQSGACPPFQGLNSLERD